MVSVFSTYSQRENRVTSTFTALLRTLSIEHAQQLIGMLLEDPELELIRIADQVREDASVPDAEFSGNFKILIETKVAVGVVDETQLKKHLEVLPNKDIPREKAKLILLTPDVNNPLPSDHDSRVKWLNFADLVEAIKKLEETSFLSEKDRFLMMHFCTYLEEEGLLGLPDDVIENRVLVVPAGMAWEEYMGCNAYICQEKRSFRPSSRLAFYTKGEIKPRVPRILAKFDSVFFPEESEEFIPEEHILLSHDEEKPDKETMENLERVIRYWSKKRGEYGKRFKVLLLSPFIEDDKAEPCKENNGTWHLPAAVKHEPEGKMTAYVMKHRYVSFDSLKKAKTTSELEDHKDP